MLFRSEWVKDRITTLNADIATGNRHASLLENGHDDALYDEHQHLEAIKEVDKLETERSRHPLTSGLAELKSVIEACCCEECKDKISRQITGYSLPFRSMEEINKDYQAVVMRRNALACQKSASEAKARMLQERKEKLYEVEKLRAELGEWQALKAALGPNGVRSRMLACKVKEFNEEVNNLLSLFAPGIIIDSDPFMIWGKLKGGKVPVGMLSKSQRARISLALQTAIAKRSGFNIVAYDPDCGFSGPTEKLVATFVSGNPQLQGVQFIIIVQNPSAYENTPPTTKLFTVKAGITTQHNAYNEWQKAVA